LPSDAPTAFFSYSRDDLEFALRLAKDLKKAGANVWMDKLDIRPGQLWERKVEDALGVSGRMLVILSPSAINSPNVMAEVAFALDEQKEVIPVLHRDCKIPFRLRPFQYVDFRTDYAQGLEELLNTVGAEQVPDENERKRAADQAAGVKQQATESLRTQAMSEEGKDYLKAAEAGDAGAMLNLGHLYKYGNGVRKDHTEAVAWYRKAAEAGNANAMFNLGLMYKYGDGVDKDDSRAVAWYRKAAEAGSVLGMNNLGWMYENGRGVERDLQQAVGWYREAAQLGAQAAKDHLKRLGESAAPAAAATVESQPAVSDVELEGVAEQQRLEDERKQAAEHERLEARSKLAAAEKARLGQQERERMAAAEKARLEQQERSGGPTSAEPLSSFARSPAWMKIALAACGIVVVALILYSVMRPKQEEVKTETPAVQTQPSSPPPAAEVSSGSAAAGQGAAVKQQATESLSAQAMNAKGDDYYYGRSGVSKDYQQAVSWYRKAAEAGNAAGMANLGWMYQNGWGVDQDYKEAVIWYRKAAGTGYADGMYNLGTMYENGYGVEKNYNQAVSWYRKAAEAGGANGMKGMGVMYENGWGVEKDQQEAIAWYRKAARLGYQPAKDALRRLGESP
jgi:TPR repeat protein